MKSGKQNVNLQPAPRQELKILTVRFEPGTVLAIDCVSIDYHCIVELMLQGVYPSSLD